MRAFGDGFISLLLPLYLLKLGFTPFQVGVIATTTLFGSGLMTLAIGLWSYRYHLRSLLLAGTVLAVATGAGFAGIESFWPLLVIAFVGTLNPSSGDISIFLPLEHSMLSGLVADRDRTKVLAWYSVIGSLMGAAGALAAALPGFITHTAGWSDTASIQAMFGLYALIGAATGWVYRGLPREATAHTDAGSGASAPKPRSPLGESKKKVYLLAALFSIDALGGGFMMQSILALWLYQRFQLSAAAAGSIFFWAGLLTAVSFLVAVRVARRFGLINTMVYTQMASNVCLLLIPFMPAVPYVMALMFIRSTLSQMDVPTRGSYVMAIVSPPERPAAASITSVPRALASSVSPVMAGYLLTVSTFGWPLIVAGGLKVVYSVLLYVMFQKVKPPEEMQAK
jgi:MFS family permease